MENKELIEILERKIIDVKESDEDMDSASWGYEYGVLISGNQAEQIVSILKSHPLLVEALKGAIRIKDLWAWPSEPMHEENKSEYEALNSMLRSFETALNSINQ